MVFRSFIMSLVRSVIFPLLSEMLDAQVVHAKKEIDEVEELSVEGKTAVKAAIDRLVLNIKSALAGKINPPA